MHLSPTSIMCLHNGYLLLLCLLVLISSPVLSTPLKGPNYSPISHQQDQSPSSGCNTANGSMIHSGTTHYTSTLSSSLPSITSMDICFLVSSTQGMSQRWMQVLAPSIDNKLQQIGIGNDSSNRNRFCVIQFGARGSNIKAKFLPNINTFFVSEEMITARKALKRNGFVADGYQAIKFALDHTPFRTSPSVGRSIVMATNLGRTVLSDYSHLSISLLSNLIGRLNATLDVIVNMSLQAPTYLQDTPTFADTPLGFYNLSSTIINNGSGRGYYGAKGRVQVSNSRGNSLNTYVKLALDVGGGAWSLDSIINVNNSLISSLAVAMVDGWSLSLLGTCQECRCIDGKVVCVRGRDQRKCQFCLDNNRSSHCSSNFSSGDSLIGITNITVSTDIQYHSKTSNSVVMVITGNRGDISYSYLHFNSSQRTGLQYVVNGKITLNDLKGGLHKVLIIGATPDKSQTAKIIEFEVKAGPLLVTFLDTSVDSSGILTIPFKTTWTDGVSCVCGLTSKRLANCNRHFTVDPSVEGTGPHTLKVACIYTMGKKKALSKTAFFNFVLNSAVTIPSTPLSCNLTTNYSCSSSSNVVAYFHCNRRANTSCSISNMPHHSCTSSYAIDTSSYSPGNHLFNLKAEDEFGYTYTSVAIFTVLPRDRRCCPTIFRPQSQLSITNNNTNSSSVMLSVALGVGNCSTSERFSYHIHWGSNSQSMQGGTTPIHHNHLYFSRTFLKSETSHLNVQFTYCNHPNSISNSCCDSLTLPLSLS